MINVISIILILITLSLVILLLNRLKRIESSLKLEDLGHNEDTALEMVPEEMATYPQRGDVRYSLVPINPLYDLEYKDALRIIPLFEKLEMMSQLKVIQAVEEFIRIEGIPVEVQNALAPLTQSVRLIDSIQDVGRSGQIVWELSKEGKQAVKKGLSEIMKTKDGRSFLPITRDGAKKFKELFKGRDPSELLKVTKLANVIVNAANIISGADQAKKLKIIGKKIDELLRRHDAELASRLEANFFLVKDILSSGEAESQRTMLLGVRKELYELRANWRGIIVARIDSTEDPNERLISRYLKTIGQKNRSVYEGLSFENEISLIEFSLALTMLIDSIVGITSDGLSFEIGEYRDILDEWKGKVKTISKDSEERRMMNSQLRGYTGFVETIAQFQSAGALIHRN